MNAPLSVAAPGVLHNDLAPAGNALIAKLVSGPAHGSVTLRPDGSFTYPPAAGFSGTDTFTYLAQDSVTNVASAPGAVSITVGPNPAAGGIVPPTSSAMPAVSAATPTAVH